MLEYLARYAVPAAYDVLPPEMTLREASALLLAIALQETDASKRKQFNGPARGFWQFETGGIVAVLKHPASTAPARAAIAALCYPPSMTAADVRVAIEHNDVLAAVFARLLLWTLPGHLAGQGMADIGWMQYLQAWEPGKPRPGSWRGNFDRAWALVTRNVS